jgi:hypothetical protein
MASSPDPQDGSDPSTGTSSVIASIASSGAAGALKLAGADGRARTGGVVMAGERKATPSDRDKFILMGVVGTELATLPLAWLAIA